MLVAAACGLVAVTAAAGDAGRWVLLFAAVPPPPARAIDALAQVGVRAGAGDRLALEVTDPALRKLQNDIDALHAQEAAVSAAVVGERLRAVESDAELARVAREIDRVLKLSSPNAPPSSPGEVRALEREVTRTLTGSPPKSAGTGPGKVAAAPAAILAYRSERQKSGTSGGSFHKRLSEVEWLYGGLHALGDREALAQLAAAGDGAGTGATRTKITNDLVEAHHALAQQQLAELAALFVEARIALRPVVEHMAKLAQDAEAQGASAIETGAAYAFLKSHAELLLTINRVALEDAGFWSGVRARAGSGSKDAPYEFAQAPGVDLRVSAEPVVPGAPYPPGRTRSNATPGIR